MSRIHLALNTDHFEESIEFYGKLFKQPPAKIRPDWAKFDLSNPPLNLTLNRRERAAAPADINHMGIELDSSEAVTQMDEHLQQQGLDLLPARVTMTSKGFPTRLTYGRSRYEGQTVHRRTDHRFPQGT